MILETIAIGDELLTGKIADTNTAFVGAELFRRGLRLDRSQAIADDIPAIQRVLRECGERADFLICFGGLGPTSDDKTAQCIAELLGTTVVDDPVAMERLKEFASKRNRVVTPQMLKQVKYPSGTDVLFNGVGLAPGFSCLIGKARAFFLPGVPTEMRPMFLESVLPVIEERLASTGAGKFLSRVWKCIGIPESELQRLMDPVEAALPASAWLGYRTKFPENHLVLYWKSAGGDEQEFEAMALRIREMVAHLSYTEKDEELEEQVSALLRARAKTIAFAESCTAGLCAQRLGRLAGASDVLWGSAVVYQRAAKKELLGVDVPTDEAAVSAECSLRLAQELKKRSGCDLAVAVTGYSGPTGGTAEDPVGTFYIALVGEKTVQCRLFAAGHNREQNQWGAATHVLNQVRLLLASSVS